MCSSGMYQSSPRENSNLQPNVTPFIHPAPASLCQTATKLYSLQPMPAVFVVLPDMGLRSKLKNNGNIHVLRLYSLLPLTVPVLIRRRALPNEGRFVCSTEDKTWNQFKLPCKKVNRVHQIGTEHAWLADAVRGEQTGVK